MVRLALMYMKIFLDAPRSYRSQSPRHVSSSSRLEALADLVLRTSKATFHDAAAIRIIVASCSCLLLARHAFALIARFLRNTIVPVAAVIVYTTRAATTGAAQALVYAIAVGAADVNVAALKIVIANLALFMTLRNQST